MTRLRFAALAALVLAAGSTAASGFAFIDPVVRWAAGPVTMHFRLGGDSGTRIDGSTSWAEPVESALADWNPYFTGREFRAVRESTLPIALGDQVNSVFFFNQIFGRPFDSDTLAVTVGLTSGDWLVPGDVIVETDVIFNSTQRWNSYRGPLRQAMAGGTLYDIRRVALHEFGHVVGLDHPDAWGQTVASIMNSVLSNTEFLTADDIGGALSLYSGGSGGGGGGGGGVTVNFPPRNESQAFRNNLEAQYRDVLRRNPTASSVDLEGSVVWTQEYLRYRVNRCSHGDAVTRVMMQIGGQGIQPVCGTGTTVVFPPRNEPFNFRSLLEAMYRDGLRRPPQQTFVDTEGDVVWTQEYLRYRVSGCTHDVGQERVFQQIAGLGVQPDCSGG